MPPKNKSEDELFYENLFDRDVDTKNRIVYLRDEVSDLTQDLVQKALNLFNADPSKPITIEVNSYGGCVYSMLGIIDCIKASPCHIITKTMGKSMSAATLIFSAGDERLIGRNSWMMVHQVSDEFDGKLEDLQVELDQTTELQNQMYGLYREFTGITEKQWKKWCKKNYYIKADEAVEHGLATDYMPIHSEKG